MLRLLADSGGNRLRVALMELWQHSCMQQVLVPR